MKCFSNSISCCACYTGESAFEVKTEEADSSDHIEHPRDDKPRLYLCTVWQTVYNNEIFENSRKKDST